MNPTDLPTKESSDQPEIFRLLKIGDYAVVPENSGFGIVSADEKKKEEQKNAPDKRKPFYSTLFVPKSLTPAAGFIKQYKGILIYPAIFFGSFLFFYTAMNLPSLVAQAEGWFSRPQDNEILGEELDAYNKWIQGYFYSVTEKDLLAVNNDYDHDGMTNLDEYRMRTNPTLVDSDSDGTTDGVELLNGTNPWGAGVLTPHQNKLKGKIDLNMVSERITFNVSSNKGTKTNDATAANFDLDRPGKLTIPKLRVDVPLVWSKDPEAFDADLQKGVIHYPGTALPGSIGTMYVSGHSSDFLWKRHKYSTVFSKINFLAAGDDVFVTVYGKDGKVYNYRYRVTEQNVYAPDDQRQFIDNSKAKINLSTCWPIGTSKDRMVVSAELVSL